VCPPPNQPAPARHPPPAFGQRTREVSFILSQTVRKKESKTATFFGLTPGKKVAVPGVSVIELDGQMSFINSVQ
jgi:hypothetical protein